MSVNALFQFRRDTAANWTASNPLLLSGEMGLETDTGKIKFGDGVTLWNALAYFTGSAASNFANSEVVAGSGTAWTLAHTPLGTPLLVVMVAGFGGVTLLLGQTPGFTIAGTAVTTTNSYSAGEVFTWYQY